MGQVDRFSVSLDTELLAAFDRHIATHGYENRSEAVRDMIRDLLVSDRLRREDEPIILVIAFLLDLDAAESIRRVAEVMATHADVVTSASHFPLEGALGVVMALRGPSGKAHAVAGELQSLRGVMHARLSVLPVSLTV